MPPPNPFVDAEITRLGASRPTLEVPAVPYYAQCGEDLIVQSLIAAHAFSAGVKTADLRYCEVGGNHPIATSATYLLSQQMGMSGVVVEANPALVGELERLRPADRVVNVAVVPSEAQRTATLVLASASELSSLDRSFVEQWPGEGGGVLGEVEVQAMSLAGLFEQFFDGQAPTYLSIDTEGEDVRLLESLLMTPYRPGIVQAEPSDHHHAGNSQAMVRLMRHSGYVLVARTAVNLIFVWPLFLVPQSH